MLRRCVHREMEKFRCTVPVGWCSLPMFAIDLEFKYLYYISVYFLNSYIYVVQLWVLCVCACLHISMFLFWKIS